MSIDWSQRSRNGADYLETWKALLRKPPSKFMQKERDTRWLLKKNNSLLKLWR